MMKDRVVSVLSNTKVADEIFEMVVHSEDFPELIVGGQFIHVELPSKAHPLRRPFCIADYDVVAKTVTIDYAVIGEGTEILSNVAIGSKLKALFPLGNGFSLDDSYKTIALVGGGMGVAVLPAIPTTWKNREYHSFLGFANASKAVLVDSLREKGEVYIATDDGSLGEKGFVTSLLRSKLDEVKPDVILCCGPEIMYKSLARELEGIDIPVFISLERRMGCGVGACLVCNCKVKTAKGDKYLRACVDGPVFPMREVIL